MSLYKPAQDSTSKIRFLLLTVPNLKQNLKFAGVDCGNSFE